MTEEGIRSESGSDALEHAQETAGNEAAEAAGTGGQVRRKKRRRHRSKLKRRLKIAGMVAAVVLLVCGGVALAAYGLMKAGELSFKQPAQDLQTGEDAVSTDEGRTVEYKGQRYALNEDMVSIVFIGYDKMGTGADPSYTAGQADTVMVVALDTGTGEATVINVPRDSMVDVGEFAGDAYLGQDVMQLAMAFSYGDGADGSCQNVTTAVSRLLYNMPMQYYVALNVAGIGPLNDAVGGVALTPLQSIPGTGIVEGEPTVLYGENAQKYVRWRDTSQLDSSSMRQQRQMQYVEEFVKKAFANAHGNAGSFIDLYEVAKEYSVTNLGMGEYMFLAAEMLSHGITSMDVVTLPGEVVPGSQFVECHLDKDAVYQTVLDVYYERVG